MVSITCDFRSCTSQLGSVPSPLQYIHTYVATLKEIGSTICLVQHTIPQPFAEIGGRRPKKTRKSLMPFLEVYLHRLAAGASDQDAERLWPITGR